jgi:acetylornithine/succinyldiaminopimelate/putrescine aminotransferase
LRRRWSRTAASIRCSSPIQAPEANEGAIKLARKYGAKYKNGAFEIITFEGGFHGRTLATMSASGKKAFEPLFEPKVSGFRKGPNSTTSIQ